MRKHGWQLPYHPLQVVAVAVFLALGFAFYVFFVPFVGGDELQYVLVGLYTPLITCVVVLYIWCAATDPGDPGIFKLKRHTEIQEISDHECPEGKSLSDGCSAVNNSEKLNNIFEGKDTLSQPGFTGVRCFICAPFSCLCKKCFHLHDQSSEQQSSEAGMFFCSLCEAEIIMQWLVGTLVLILCFMKRGEFSGQIISKLGSSFSTASFVVVVVSLFNKELLQNFLIYLISSDHIILGTDTKFLLQVACTLLAVVATIPLSQLLCFHILLIKKGISTYDYIVALREQEEQQEHVEQHSPQMSIMSSVTGFSTTSSVGPLHRGSWCTPPRLLLEDQYVSHPDMAQYSMGKKMKEDKGTERKPPVRISPWTLARLNAEEVSKASAEAKRKSKVLQPIPRRGEVSKPEGRRPDTGRVFLPEQFPDARARTSASGTDSNFRNLVMETPGSLAPLQHEARGTFQPSVASSIRNLNLNSSPESSLDSPDFHPFRVSMSGVDELHSFMSLSASESTAQKSIALSRSTSGGYEASGGEDSERIPSRIVHRSSNWTNVILNSGREMASDLRIPTSAGFAANTRLN
ncbi:putative protein S-acyltransferase 22 [Dichanthelium oligosanthes]|uniref:Palmitoyltransferase n=1 Tax=Dichanthelium oligosanthes TaxID=888268 RepID=A0A1E5UXQ2_9POAL|nr:putative protein S-acyltransferase 22 [Dichanthelium oligosanthes]